MKKIVIFVIVIALCGCGIAVAALIRGSGVGAGLGVATKVNTPTNPESTEPTTTGSASSSGENLTSSVFGQDIFSNGRLIATQDDFNQGFSTNGQGNYRTLLWFDQFDQNKEYGFAWTINPRVLDIENLSFLTYDDRPAIFYYIGDWNTAVANGNAHMQTLASVGGDLTEILTNHWIFETGSNDTQIIFCPFLLSNQSEAPSESLLRTILSYVTLSVFELPSE